MENEQLVQRDIEILQRAQTIGANPDFVLVFGAAAVMAIIGLLCVGISMMWGWIIFGAIIAGGLVDYFTGIGDKAMIISLVLVSALLGIGSLAVAVFVWTGAGAAH
ncbi:MAG: hypothetical protein OHK0013_32310 [Sandaracinaceae bacterium]